MAILDELIQEEGRQLVRSCIQCERCRGAEEQGSWKFFWVIFFLVFFVCLTAICCSFFLWVQHGHAIFVMSFSFAFTGIYFDIWLRFVDSF